MTGWPTAYSGITCLSIGNALHSGTEWGFITAGVGLIIAGIMQICKS